MSSRFILFLQSGPAMPDLTGKMISKYDYLSRFYSGVIISPVAGEEYLQIKRVGNFDFYPFPYYSRSFFKRNFIYFWNVISCVWLYKKKHHIDVIVSPNSFFCGLIGLLLRTFVGAKVIIEINGDFDQAFKYNGLGHITTSVFDKIKIVVAKIMMRVSLKYVDAIRILYKGQLEFLPGSGDYEKKTHCFSDFVPIKSFLNEQQKDDKYILLVGYPWLLKGVDILIKAFCQISEKFPAYRLKIVGWCPEGKEYFEELVDGNTKVELCDPVLYSEITPLFARCSLYVLASRTEAMGRVLLEAMACEKPIIACRVGGVPFIIEDGYNGLLFEKEDVADLAAKMEMVLSNQALTDKIAKNGLHYVQEKLSEERYVENFRAMIESLMG